MSVVAGAAVPVFSSRYYPARRVSSNVALCLSLHSSPLPTLLSSSKLSASNLDHNARRYKRRGRRRVADAKASSFSIDSDEEELGYGHEGAEGLQFAGRRNATWRRTRDESFSKARVSRASGDQGNFSRIPQRQQTRGVKPVDMRQARGSLSLENEHASRNRDRDNALAHNKRRPWQEQSRSSFEEQQHHRSFVGKKHPGVPLPTKNQRSRMHNKVSVFESIRQPSISELSSNNCADASSWGVEDADVAPSDSNRQALISQEGSRHRIKNSQLTTQHGIKENIRRGAKFMSKLEEVLSNLRKKGDLSRENLAMNQEALRDESISTCAGQGFRGGTNERKKAEESGSLKRNGMQGAKSVAYDIESSARDANITIARDDNRGYALMNDGKGLQSEAGEARSMIKENERVDNEPGFMSFNLFSSSPSVPWEADRKYASTFKPRIPIRRGNVSPLARRSFTSIGSRSSPSRPSVNSRNVSYPKLDSHAATGVVDPSKLIGGDEQMESWFDMRGDIELNDDKFTTQIASQKRAPKAEEQVETVDFDWSESDAEENGDDALSTQLCTEEISIEENAPTNSSLSAASLHSIFDWHDSDSEVDEDNVFSIDADVEDDAPTEFASNERSDHNKKYSSYSADSDVEDAEPPKFDSRESSLHNKKEILSASMSHTEQATSAALSVDMTLGASEMANGSNHTNSAGWHKHNSRDLPFEFQFSYSETPKAPILGYRETPYSPFGPSTMGRPWTGGPPPKPSKKKQRVFDSFNPPPKDKKGVKFVQDPGPYPEGQGPKPAKSREELMGEPLTKEEIVYLVEKCERESRQLNLGRDGLTHNMLDLIHCHWKRRRVCKIKCKGVPTLDMDNVKFHIEDKTGGKIIYHTGGVLYLFRGRNYNYKDRPQIPLMLWKPVTPLYPKLIQPAPEGLTKEEAQRLRVLGRKVQPICRLGKNGVYLNLVKDVRAAFKVDELVRIDCQGLNPRDYKKIGAKLKDLVPCVLLSFDKEHILMWKGKQEPAVEGGSLSSTTNLEPHLADEQILKQSSITDEGKDGGICGNKVNISVAEASYPVHGNEGETEEKMHQSYSEQESSSMLAYASQVVSTHSCDAEVAAATSVLQIAKEQTHVQFHSVNIDETFFPASTIDEGHALTGIRETSYAGNPQLLKEETIKMAVEEVNISMHESSNLGKISSMGDEILFDTIDSISEGPANTDRKLRQEREREGPNTAFEEMSKSVNSMFWKDGDKDLGPLEAASSKEPFVHEVDGLASDEEKVTKCLDSQTNSVVRLDALWDHAFASGMALELSEEGMDEDVIVRKAAQLAQLAPLGPTYTTKLMYKLQLKRDENKPNDSLQIRFGRGKPQKIAKKVVKRKFQLPTLDVPGMGGLPVDELARLLAPKQTP